MLRHFQLFAPAPGREAEAERALSRWLEAVSGVEAFRGGCVLREYAREFGDVEGALALTYDVDSREGGAAFREATASIPNPTRQDVPGGEVPDQWAVLFEASGHDHDHAHEGDGHDGHGHLGEDVATVLSYNRGGGLFARLMHGHFTVVSEATPASAVTADRTGGS